MSRISAAPLLGSALLFGQMVERRVVRKAMHHHQPHDASAFGTFERLHRVALDHRRYRDNGPFNVAKTAFVSAHVPPLMGHRRLGGFG
jgi:hypothetical protein